MNDIGSDNRQARRHSSMYAITVIIGDRQITGRVKDHSLTGCKLKLEEPLRIDDTEIRMVRGDLTMSGTIVWRDGVMIGVNFSGLVVDGMFSPARREALPEAHTLTGIDQIEPFRRPGLKSEKIVGERAEHARLWASGQLGSRR